MFAALKAGKDISDIKTPAPASTPYNSPAPQNNSDSNDRGGSSDKRNQVKVFNIPDGTADDELKDFFSSVGEVKHVKILPCREGKSVTLGFVEFVNGPDVQKAIDEKNEQDFNGSTLKVQANEQQGARPRNNDNSGSGGGTQVKVFNIPDGTDQDSLRALMSDAGEIKNVKILPCREGRDTTIGFVLYADVDSARNAAQNFNNYEFNGQQLRVMVDDRYSGPIPNGTASPAGVNGHDSNSSRPMGRGARLLAANENSQYSNGGGDAPQRKPQAKVFGIPEGTSKEQVEEYFSGAGSVTFVKLLPIREGKDTHLGFVEFNTIEEVNKAVEMYDGTELEGSRLKVMVGQQGGGGGAPPSFNQQSFIGSNEPTSRIPHESGPDFRDTVPGGDFDMSDCLDTRMPGVPSAVTYIPPPPPETEQDIFMQGTHEGINFEKYESIPVELTGEDPPASIRNFQDANIHKSLLANIKRAKYKKPTPVQKFALPAILAKRDLMACAQTGSGKTASFLIPVITNILNEGFSDLSEFDSAVMPLVAILSPTRELAVQIFSEARKFSYETSLKVCVVYGGVNVNHQLDRLRMGCHILVATPGRLADFVKKGKINFRKLQYLILDEADRMLDMGFGPQINDIMDSSEMPTKTERTTLMFSATFPDEIQQMAGQFLHKYLFLTVGRVGGTCSDVNQSFLQIEGSKKRSKLEEILVTSAADRTLVFVERKRDADFLASFLSQRNYPATSLNADRTQQEREAALLDFRKGRAPVLVATAVAGRGLDINDVKHVINYDLPSDCTEYVHRVGRTGRIGNKGKATSFFDVNRDQKLARGLIKLLADAEQDVPGWLEQVAMEAVGTGYGQEGSKYQDRRENFRGRAQNGASSAPAARENNFSNANSGAVDDENDEW